MENKKKTNYFKIICYIFLFAFLIVYIVNKSGYIGTLNYNKTLNTEAEIKEFEMDVDNNKTIKSQYIKTNDKDYSNEFSIMGEKISSYIKSGGEYLTKKLTQFFSLLFK